jgi:hypothetical protein
VHRTALLGRRLAKARVNRWDDGSGGREQDGKGPRGGAWRARVSDWRAHAGTVAARQVIGRRLRALTAASRDAEIELQIAKGARACFDAGANLSFGDGVTYANVHANNYRKLFAFAQAAKCKSLPFRIRFLA